jgi:guanine deaminase
MSMDTQTTASLPCELAAFSRRSGLQEDAHAWHEDGLLIVEDGRVKAAGDYAQLRHAAGGVDAGHDYRGKIITPGFIDTHLHYPADRHDRLAGAGPAALAGDLHLPDRAPVQGPGACARDRRVLPRRAAALRHHHGHGLLHRAPESVDAFFEASEARNLRMVAGKVLMDRHCPDFLRDTAESACARAKS